MRDQFEPAGPLGRLKLSSSGVVSATVPATPTTGVAVLVAELDPAVFVAVSLTLIVAPRSAAASRYDDPVAPAMLAQLAALASQRCHCSLSVGAGLPAQLPAVTVNVCPCTAEPVTTGSTWFTGPLPAAATTGVAVLVAELDPAVFVAVSLTLIVAGRGRRRPGAGTDDPVAPAMLAQLAPPASQRCHCSLSVGAGLPAQLPAVTVNVCPCTAEPVTTGST